MSFRRWELPDVEFVSNRQFLARLLVVRLGFGRVGIPFRDPDTTAAMLFLPDVPLEPIAVLLAELPVKRAWLVWSD